MRRNDFSYRDRFSYAIRWARFIPWMLLITVFMAVLGGCGGRIGVVQKAAEEDVKDALFPTRIVSLLPSNTELLAALSATDRLVCVTSNDTYPPDVTRLPYVGDMTVNGEAVLACAPDLVLASPYQEEDVVPFLRRSGIPVLVVPEARNLTDIVTALVEVGRAIGADDRAQAVAAHLTTVLETFSLPDGVREGEPRIWLEIAPPPELYTAGGDTFLGEALRRAGGRGLADAETGWPLWSAEDVLAKDPDIILLLHHAYPDVRARAQEEQDRPRPVRKAPPDVVARLAERPGWAKISAIRHESVYVLDEDIFSRPTPRLIEALPELAYVLAGMKADAAEDGR